MKRSFFFEVFDGSKGASIAAFTRGGIVNSSWNALIDCELFLRLTTSTMVLTVGAFSFFCFLCFCMFDELFEYIGCIYTPNVFQGKIYSAFCFSLPFHCLFFSSSSRLNYCMEMLQSCPNLTKSENLKPNYVYNIYERYD